VEGSLEILPRESRPDAAVVDPAIDAASQPFVGRWNRLVSMTNWEKGRIITEWRAALVAAGAPVAEYADEAWARRVGGVTGQHAGRLRRVYQRFGQKHDDYRDLYWSHFQSALDWDDAELWLEGAVQSGWSISEMRRKRWEAMGALAAEQPRDGDIVVAEIDEDFTPGSAADPGSPRASSEFPGASGPLPEGPDFGGVAPERAGRDAEGAALFAEETPGEAVPLVRPFEHLAELPADLAEAFEAFKLAILCHKTDQWRQISRADVLASLDALKALALAPSVD
jgi:hypothetical protein